MISAELLSAIEYEVSKGVRASRQSEGGAPGRLSAYNIPFKNDSGEIIPPYAAMRPDALSPVTASGGNWFLKMKKPDDEYRRRYYINGPAAIPVDGLGMCSDCTYPTLARWNGDVPDDGAIVSGVGVRSGFWYISDNSIGDFTYLDKFGSIEGTYAYDLVLVTQQDATKLIVRGDGVLQCGGIFGPANICRSKSCVETTLPVQIVDRQFGFDQQFPDGTLFGVDWVNGAWFIDWYDQCPVDYVEP